MKKRLFARGNAEGGSRTLTRGEPDGILNPARLPVPPLRLIFFKIIFKIMENVNSRFQLLPTSVG